MIRFHPLNIIIIHAFSNILSCLFVPAFFVDFELGQPANILVKIFDEVSEGDNKSMGSCLFNIGATLGAKVRRYSIDTPSTFFKFIVSTLY